MHRTWLWASITAAAVYTWLYLHWEKINSEFLSDTHFPVVWFIPPILLCFCAIRYFVFWNRVRHLALYMFELEDKAFPVGPRGVAHWNARPCWRKLLAVFGASIFWAVLVVSSAYVSWNLSQKKAPPGSSASVASPPAASAHPSQKP
jgi:hypothetical protein